MNTNRQPLCCLLSSHQAIRSRCCGQRVYPRDVASFCCRAGCDTLTTCSGSLLPLTTGPALGTPNLPCFPGPRLSLLSLRAEGKRKRSEQCAGEADHWISGAVDGGGGLDSGGEGRERVNWSGRSGSTHEATNGGAGPPFRARASTHLACCGCASD